ncbi:MAG TPA: hypothetical protein VFH95_10555, partial [Candidatus Kapabacteria bacterium]|nr:hypothetical protein [Candidatus Kapabacteria bacterium]
LHLASEKQKNILPVVIEKVKLPSNFEYSLAGLQRVQYDDRPAILQALETLQHGIAVTEPLPISAPAPADNSIRIAVLPFDDLSPDHDNQWFADGMMDELISTLGSLDRVKVPSRSDVLHYRKHQKKSREIARELGVRYLIEGGVRKANAKIRINASLIDTLCSEQIWTNKFDGSFEDVFAFQELVAKNITDALKLKLTPTEEQLVEDHGTQNAEAYELYLKGRHEQYYLTKESYLRALDLYEAAAALDPKFARAHLGAASICCAYYREYSRDPKWLDRAGASLASAEAITGESSNSLRVRGMIAWLKGDNPEAISFLTRATELDSKNLSSYNILGNIQISIGNYPAAIHAFQRAADLEGSTQAYFNLLTALSNAKDRVRLLETANKALPVFARYLLREPGDQSALVSRAFVLFWADRIQEAEDAAALLLARDDLSGQALYNLGCLFSSAGNQQTFVALFRKAIDRGFRSIEEARSNEVDIQEPNYRLEFQQLLSELETIIERENAIPSMA